VQVYNETSRALPAATNLTIYDAQNNVYTPLVPAQTNPFTYQAGMVPGKGQLPLPGTIAANGPSQGALLLFKLQVYSLDNRPIKLKIVDPTDEALTASAVLDV